MRLDLIFTMKDIKINSNLEPLPKFASQQTYPPMKHFLGNHRDHPNQHKNNQKLSNEKEHLPLFYFLFFTNFIERRTTVKRTVSLKQCSSLGF